MKKAILGLIAALALSTVTLTGLLAAVEDAATPADTTWGAPAADTPVCCKVIADTAG